MKKLTILLVLFCLSKFILGDAFSATSSNSTGQTCIQRLTDNHQKNSNHFKIGIDDFEYASDKDLEIGALRHLLNKIGCDNEEISNFTCKHLSDFEYSYSCTGHIQGGYFFVAPDMLDHVNIIFNRFD